MLLGKFLRDERERSQAEVEEGGGDRKRSFVVAVLGWEELSTRLAEDRDTKGERLGYFRKNEEKGLACSLEGGDPESLKCGGGGGSPLRLCPKTSLWNWRHAAQA